MSSAIPIVTKSHTAAVCHRWSGSHTETVDPTNTSACVSPDAYLAGMPMRPAWTVLMRAVARSFSTENVDILPERYRRPGNTSVPSASVMRSCSNRCRYALMFRLRYRLASGDGARRFISGPDTHAKRSDVSKTGIRSSSDANVSSRRKLHARPKWMDDMPHAHGASTSAARLAST